MTMFMTSSKMSERKFSRGLGKPGMAAQIRETVSQAVRETTVLTKPQLVEPVDFETFILKNKTLLQNDPQRELLLYPPDDVSQVVLPRRFRTTTHSVPANLDTSDCTLFTKECVKSYTSNWNLIHYKYSAYSGTYLELPKILKTDELKDEVYEVDTDADQVDEELFPKNDGITKQGFLMKGPEVGSDRMFVNLGSKSFKRRYCYLRQEVDGTYILELHKDEKKGEAKATIVMDFCTDVVRNLKRGRFCFELRMTAGHKSFSLAAENESEMNDWICKLNAVLQHNKLQEEKRAASLERANNTPPPSPQPVQMYGTLKGLEQSMNPQLMKYARETDVSIALARREHRRRLFSMYPHMPHVKTGASSSSEQNIDPYREQFGHRLLVRCESIRFRLQAPIDGEKESLCQVEPYLTTLSLFDAKQGRKLTENFHFDVNHIQVRSMVPCVQSGGSRDSVDNGLPAELHQLSEEWLMFPKQAVFSVSKPHPDIYVVVRIDKVLQGGICQTSEPYIRSTKDPRLGLRVHKSVKACRQSMLLDDSKNLEPIRDDVDQAVRGLQLPGMILAWSFRSCKIVTLHYVSRLGNYRMPFAWTARPLFRLYSNELDTTSDFPAIYRQEGNRLKDEELLKVLSEYRKPDKMSRLTVIPGWIKIKIEAVTELPENCLTSSLAPLKPFPVPPTSEPTIEMSEFESSSEKEVHPYTTFVNHLYVYPHSLCFDTQKTFTRARNIACLVELRDSDDEGSQPLRCLYGRPGGPLFVTQISCTVLHHSTSPSWYEEVKVRLPICLHSKHHLLFTFYHISCDSSKKRDNGVETCVGYAWIPLLQKGRLNVDEQVLPVAASLPAGYLSVQPLGLGKGVIHSNAGPDISWIDGQRPIFNVGFQLVSTVNTRDQHLHNLFAHAERLIGPKHSSIIPSEQETCKILKAAHAVHLVTAITFLPTLLNQLMTLLVVTTNEEVGLNVLRVLIHIIHLIHEAGRKEILQAYVKFVFVPPDVKSNTTVHEEMSRHLPTLLRPANTDFLVVNKFMHHSGFFFEVMVKSMAQHLLSSGRIKMHRNERFSGDFTFRVQNLLQVLCPYITQKYKDMPLETQELNSSLAYFLKRCLTFMDRGYVFKLINSYMDKFNPGDTKTLYDYKFTFLQVICSHEHFVVFNLPLSHSRLVTKNRIDYVDEYCLSEEFCRQHFLVGLLLQEVRTSLNEVFQVRKVAVATLRDLLAKHELDDRYQNKGQLARIATLYVPLLTVVLENLNRLNSGQEQSNKRTEYHNVYNSSSRMSSSSSFLNFKDTASTDTPKSLHRFTMLLDSNSSVRASMHARDSSYFAAIAGQVMLNGSSSVSLESDTSTMSGDAHSTASQETAIIREDLESNREHLLKRHSRSLSSAQTNAPIRCDKLQPTEVKDLLLCFMFVVKYLGDEYLVSWWQHCSESEVLNFFRGIEMCLHHFKYIGKRQIMAKTGNRPASAKAMTLPARMQPPDFSSDSNALGTHSGSSSVGRESVQQIVSESESSKMYQALLEANMATEVGLIALDSLGLYCIHFKDNLLIGNGDNLIMRKVFDIYLSFLQVGQSETLFRHVFAALRAYINNFSVALFQGNAVLCGRLCYELLRCCNSRLSTIRQESCAILYLLMRSNFEFTNRKGLTRVHLQVIISVSQMLGNVVGLNNARFQESLSLINSYASSDKVMKGTGFPSEVKDLTKRIRTVLMATAQMREHHQDPEMLVDLQHSLANSYASTPELRHTWLETMTRNHDRDGNYSEAACCQLHIAALMAEYLKLKNVHPWGAEAFKKISSNIPRDERSLKLDAGVQDIQYTEYILLEQLERCAEFLEKAERYELLGELYRLILPMYEQKRNYEMLAQCYRTLAQAYNKIVEVSRTGRRLLGRYYRVAFFGQAYFEEDSGVEYIYKEPKVTSLSEISERLHQLYSDKFGQELVKIIMDSAPINSNDLDPKYAYIQVTHVTPYFEKSELEERQTDFEQGHDINCFMFETPFTKDGKARGTPEDQWKRRTILTTQYSFPYVKKRILVVKRRLQELNPIEVALDEMQMRVAELEDVVFTKPTDAKKLQLRLQGSVCVQVNAGPLAYASTFLDASHSSQYQEEKVEELKDVFREFVKICYTALQINSKIISADQLEYQEVLCQNYQKLCHNLSTLFGEALWPDDELGCFKRNSQALFSAISGASGNSSTA